MSEQAVIRLMQASSCFGRETCQAPPCACARSLNDLLGARQDAEIAQLREQVRVCSGALTPVSENEKRGMERVLAILDRKIVEGGVVVSSDVAAVERHNSHHRARWSAFRECAMMLRLALDEAFDEDHGPREGEHVSRSTTEKPR